MKRYLMPLLLAAALFTPALAQEEGMSKAEAAKMEREEKKAAYEWIKQEMNTLRKTTSLLKKIKNEKTVKSSLKEIQSMYGLGGGKTAMGEAAPASKPEGDAYLEQEAKNATVMKKIRKELKAEIDRVKALELGNDDLDSALEWLEENRL